MKTRTNADKQVDRYLIQLDRALLDLPAARRAQVVEEVAGHIAESRSTLDDEDEASIQALLDRVGDPNAIAEEAGASRASIRAADAWVPWLLLFGGFALLVGWFVGIALLWSSNVWKVPDKLLGTFVLPGGLLALVPLSAWLLAAPPIESIPAFLFAMLVPIITAVHLDRARRAR
jgi:hypothetical protein